MPEWLERLAHLVRYGHRLPPRWLLLKDGCPTCFCIRDHGGH